MSARPSRRAVLAGMVGSALAATASLGQSAQRPFSAIVIDVRPLQGKGLGAFAEFLRSALAAEMERAFADRLGGGRGTPRLVVRLDGVSMAAYVGRGGGPFRSGIDSDYLEGEALVVASSGQILARHPQLSALPSSSGGAWYDPASERRRVAALAAHYAGWLRRSEL